MNCRSGDEPTERAQRPDLYADWHATELGAIAEALEDRLINELIGDEEGRRIPEVGSRWADLDVSV